MSGQLPRQSTVSWPVHGLIDRFVADMPGLLLRVGIAKPETDLFRAPIEGELLLHKIAKCSVTADQPAAGTFGFLRERAWARTASYIPRSCRRMFRRSSRLIVDGDRPSCLEISRIDKPSRRRTASRSRSRRERYRVCRSASRIRSGATPPRSARHRNPVGRAIPIRLAASIGPTPARINFQYSSSTLSHLLRPRRPTLFTLRTLVECCDET